MKRMKKMLALLLAVAMMLSVAACSSNNGSETASEGTDTAESGANNLNTIIASEPETLDPTMSETSDAGMYSMHLFEGLMTYVSTGETVGDDDYTYNTEVGYGQVESYEVTENEEGQVVYTFTLRDGISWSDGEPVVAGDFEYSWKRLVDPDNAAGYGYLFDGMVLNAASIQAGEMDASELGITAIDEKTLEVVLEADSPYFVELCAFPVLMPIRQDIVEEYGSDWTEPGNSVSNGAFVISEWVHDSYIKMVPNENYYDVDSITLDSITWWLSDSETSIVSAYESGEYDFVGNNLVPVDRIADMQDSGDLFIAPYVGTYYIIINTEVVTDWRVRAAMTLSIDREYLTDSVTQGGQSPATGIVPAGIATSEGNDWVETYGDAITAQLQKHYPDYDLNDYADRCELAQELYQEAVDEGTWNPDTTVDYAFNTSESHQAIAEALQNDWSTVLGMSFNLSNQDWNVYTQGLTEGKFGVGRLGWIADYNDPITYLELFTNGNSYNYGRWVSDEYTALISEAKALTGGAERDDLLAQAEAVLYNEGGFAIAPVYFYTNIYCRSASVQNVEYTSMGYYFFHHATIGE